MPEKRDRFVTIGCTLAAVVLATAITFSFARAQETSTTTDTAPVEGITVLPDGTAIPMTVQQSLSAPDLSTASSSADSLSLAGKIHINPELKGMTSEEQNTFLYGKLEYITQQLNRLQGVCASH